MPVDRNTIRRAHSLARDAVEDIVNESFASVARIAYGLAGSDAAGDRVVRQVVRRGLKMLHKFRDEGEPQRWFLHHTILACRRERGATPRDVDHDLLVNCDPQPTNAYRAFVKAVRALPYQQAEALILHHGESFNLRYISIAMDCSTAAAQTHLDAGTNTLRLVAGDQFDPLMLKLRLAYQRLTPDARVQVPQVGGIVRRHVWPRRLWRMLRVLIVLAAAAGLGWVLWKIVPNIEY